MAASVPAVGDHLDAFVRGHGAARLFAYYFVRSAAGVLFDVCPTVAHDVTECRGAYGSAHAWAPDGGIEACERCGLMRRWAP